jgi:hypothetical protein
MVDASKYSRVRKATVSQRGATGGAARKVGAPKESYAARRRRFFVETDAMIRDINTTLDEVERKLSRVHEG